MPSWPSSWGTWSGGSPHVKSISPVLSAVTRLDTSGICLNTSDPMVGAPPQ